jgi:microcystin degradation protein MlrC
VVTRSPPRPLPARPVRTKTFDYVSGRICDAVAAGCDAVLLDLHGAMVSASHDDAEGELLRRLREVDPHVRVGVALDMGLLPHYPDRGFQRFGLVVDARQFFARTVQ